MKDFLERGPFHAAPTSLLNRIFTGRAIPYRLIFSSCTEWTTDLMMRPTSMGGEEANSAFTQGLSQSAA